MPANAQKKPIMQDTTFYLLYILFVTTLGPFQFGYHLVHSHLGSMCNANPSQAELNAPQAVITCEKEKIRSGKTEQSHSSLPQCIPMTVDQFAIVTSIFTLGGLIGAVFAGPFCSKHGRLRAMRLMTLPFVAGAAAECLAPNISLLAFARFLSGLGAGAAIVVVPIYISETAPPDQRALFGAFTQIMTNLGILVTQTLGLFFSRGRLWRVILAVPGAISIFLLIALSLVPESPRWLAEHGQTQKAREVLHKIRGRHFDSEEMRSWDIRGQDSCMLFTITNGYTTNCYS